MPGELKMPSNTMLPNTEDSSDKSAIVTIGGAAVRNVCPKSTRRSGSPRARAAIM